MFLAVLTTSISLSSNNSYIISWGAYSGILILTLLSGCLINFSNVSKLQFLFLITAYKTLILWCPASLSSVSEEQFLFPATAIKTSSTLSLESISNTSLGQSLLLATFILD